jgi:hypothetical protein
MGGWYVVIRKTTAMFEKMYKANYLYSRRLEWGVIRLSVYIWMINARIKVAETKGKQNQERKAFEICEQYD